MADTDPYGLGRARGRSRGRPPGSVSDIESLTLTSPARSETGSDEISGIGSLRGRAGFHTSGQLITRPPGISQTAGEGGEPALLFANFITLKTPQQMAIHQYHVEFEPNVEAIRIRRAMLYDATHEMFNEAVTFDGMFDVKSLTKLPDQYTSVVATRRTDSAEIKITMKYVGEVGWGTAEMLRLFNTQMRRNLQHLKYHLMGRHFFDPTNTTKLEEFKMDLWSGVTTAIALHEAGTLMCVDTVHKVVRAETALEILKEIRSRNPQAFQDNARRELAGAIVLTNYNNKTYKIDDVVFDKNPTFEFERKGEKISMVNYYMEQYQIIVKDQRQPLLQSLPSARDKRAALPGEAIKPVLLIPELCCMTGLTESMRSNFNLKKQMTQMTQLVPAVRFTNLKNFMAKVNANPNVKEEMKKWNLEFASMPLAVTGRLLKGERIQMRSDDAGAPYVQKSGDFSKEIRGRKMRACPAQLSTWAIVVSKRDEQYVREFVSTLTNVCGPLGMTVNRPAIEVINTDRTGDFVSACRKVIQSNSGLMIVVIIVPNNNKERYDTIKKIYCCDMPIPSQVIIGRTLSKKPMLMSVCTKIGIQMAAKMGGIPWELPVPPKNLMVIGYDTYHDSTQKNKSVGGFVSSLNGQLSKWHSRVAYHSNNEEMSSHFATNVETGLKRYREVNNQLPERLVIYRDGVGEGQIQHVFNFEVMQVRRALEVLGAGHIKLTFIIVTKRVNARFFLKGQPPNLDNPLPGTIVDTDVTRPERYEFYLVSQSVRQGTVAPTCYNIIYDESGWKSQNQQMMAFKLCHTYYNWMGTIRVPAPCQYAHKLAYLVGTSLHREPSVALADNLFYL